MNYIKLSVLVKSPLIVFEYNQEGRSFWDEFCNMLKKENPTVAIEKQGAFRYSFYMQFSGTSSEAVTNAMQLISSLNVDTDNFVITSGILESSDLEALKEKDVDHITDRNWFQSAMSSIDQEESNFRKEHSEDQDAEPTVVEKSSNKPVRAHSSFIPNASSMIHIGIRDDITETRLDLSAEAQRLSTLRDILLDNVRGQRHAVDEVVQTFFECDAFNRNNEKRRGPLATFLFTGPSGVGKTFLARQCAEALGIEPLTIDMSEYSDNLANMKFNGETSRFRSLRESLSQIRCRRRRSDSEWSNSQPG